MEASLPLYFCQGTSLVTSAIYIGVTRYIMLERSRLAYACILVASISLLALNANHLLNGYHLLNATKNHLLNAKCLPDHWQEAKQILLGLMPVVWVEVHRIWRFLHL